jgi:peptide/nickel transport system substrate-binding protein
MVFRRRATPDSTIRVFATVGDNTMYQCRQLMTFAGLLITFAIVVAGCGTDTGPTSAQSSVPESTSGTAASPAAIAGEEAPAASNKPFVLGDLIAPFNPPPLEEIERTAEWSDRPVLDGLALMREHQRKLSPPELTAAKALALRNNSDEDNKRILDALGRVAPENGSGVDYEAELVLVAPVDLKTTNPLLASSMVDFDYSGLTGFGLFGFDWGMNTFGSKDSIVSWQTSKDHLIDKVVLRDDLTWSDGTPITAHDVEFTFKAIMTDAVIVWALRDGTDELSYVKAYDDRTVVFFHKAALATNVWNMMFSVLPKHIYEKSLPDDPTMSRNPTFTRLEDNPVVGGSYNLAKRVRGQEFVLERREDYYTHDGKQVRDKPYFKTVRYKVIEDTNTALLALKAGRVDGQILTAEQWQLQTNDGTFYDRNTKVRGEEWTGFHFLWNTKSPYFEDKRVRWAMSYAMDYKEMIDTIFYGLYDQSRGDFHPGSWMFPKDAPQPLSQDLDKAEDLLDQAGWIDSDRDGIRDKMIDGRRTPFEFTLHVANIDDRIQLCTLMKQCLERIGVMCHVKPTEFTVLTQMMEDRKFQAAFGGWGSGADPDTSVNIWTTGAMRNYGEYSNSKVDELFEQGKREFDREKRAEIYGQIHTLLWEDQPYTWLFNRNSFYGFNKKLRGYNFSPRGPFHYSPGIGSIYTASAAQ